MSAILPPHLRLVDDMFLGRPEVVGTYVLLGDEPALVDPGPASTLPNLESGLAAEGLALGDIRTILLTHIHLDHAGATGTLVARHPHLRVYVHQRGAPHMIAPERLLASAQRLYGDAMQQLWGEILPVPAENVTALSGGELLRVAGRALSVLDAPGHASHHVIYLDEGDGAAFVGDVAGVCLPGETYVLPPTPPPDIDLALWLRTLAQLHERRPALLLPTHFGPAGPAAATIAACEMGLRRRAEAVRALVDRGVDEQRAGEELHAILEGELDALATDVRERYRLATPPKHNLLGLLRYARGQGLGPRV